MPISTPSPRDYNPPIMALHPKQTFTARDENNQKHQIVLWVDRVNVGSYENPDATIEGIQKLATRDGRPVNYIEKGKYQVVVGGAILTSDDPDAP